jgi:hypothetical protein
MDQRPVFIVRLDVPEYPQLIYVESAGKGFHQKTFVVHVFLLTIRLG